MNIRKIADLAAELNISERQFHRRLDAGCPEARLKLRQEIIWEYSTSLTMLCNGLNEAAELLRRCDPDMAKILTAAADKLNDLVEKMPSSPWRVEQERRLQAQCQTLTDEEFNHYAENNIMPPEIQRRKS